MTKRKRYKKPLIKKIQEDMGKVINEIRKIKLFISNDLQPTCTLQAQTFIGLFEKYLKYKKETNDFVLFLDKEKEEINVEKKIINKESKKRAQEQTKGSGTPKTSGKSSKGI
jgi:hypothetical protein